MMMMCLDNLTEDVSKVLGCLTDEALSSYVPVLCVLGLLFVLGCIGNLLVLLTYYNKLESSSTNFFIFSLAIMDLISTFFGIPMAVYGLSNPYTYSSPFLCKFYSFVAFASDMSSGAIIVCISFDRYMRIARPHRGMSRYRAKALVIGGAVSTSILCSLSFFVYGVKKNVLQDEPLVIGYSCSISEAAKETAVPLVFSAIVLLCFFVGTCILFVVYTKLGIHVRQWSEQRRSSQTRPLGVNTSEESSSTRGESSERSDSKSGKEPTEGVSKKNFVVLLNSTLHNEADTVTNNLQSNSLDRRAYHNTAPNSNSNTNGYRTLPISKPSRPAQQKPSAARRKSSMPSINTIKKRMTLSKTTLMFISATVVFVLCHIPYICVKIISVVRPNISATMTPVVRGIYTFAVYSFVFTYAMNPIIYSFMNPRFRSSCKDLLKSAVTFCKPNTGSFTMQRT